MLAASDIAHAQGRATLTVELVAGQSTATSAFATSPMKLLTPRARGQSVWAYTSSFGGGFVAGDQTQLDLRIGSGARCFVGTQASTKVYRNPTLRPCRHVTHATLEAGSLLVFAPDPVQPFADSTYSQRQDFHLAPGAGLALVDWFSAGRTARGERWAFSRFQSRNEVRSAPFPLTPALSLGERENRAQPPGATSRVEQPTASFGEQRNGGATAERIKNSVERRSPFPLPKGEGQGEGKQVVASPAAPELLFLDSLLLDSNESDLASPHRTGRFNCIALLLLLGPPLKSTAARLLETVSVRPVERRAALVTSASPIRDGALLRIAGENVEQVGRELHSHLAGLSDLLGDNPWARKW